MMFCPEGFITLIDMKQNMSNSLIEHYRDGVTLSDELFPDDEFMNEIESQAKIEAGDDFDYKMYLLSKLHLNYIFYIFLMQNKRNLYITTVSGSILHVSQKIFTSLRQEAIEYENGHHNERYIITRIFKGAWDFPFIDMQNLSIDARKKEDREIDLKLNDDFRINNHCSAYWSDHINDVQRGVFVFDRCPICIKNPTEIVDIHYMRSLLLVGRSIEDEARPSPRGRPAKMPETMAAIRSLYPNGRYPSLKELAREICRARPGIDISDRTIRRALDEIRGQKSD